VPPAVLQADDCVHNRPLWVLTRSVAPTDRFKLPLRWQFAPVEHPADRSVRWKWRAFTQAGRLAMESDQAFETLTQCMDDAKAAGYGE
jgi:hypothetical protein